MKFQLIATVNHPELLNKSIHERGAVFYQQDKQGNITKAVYFSGSRVIEYIGKVDENLAKRIRAEGDLAETIEIDEFQGSVRVIQNKPAE